MNAAVQTVVAPEIEGKVQVLENRVALNLTPGGKALVIVDVEHYRQVAAELVAAKDVDREIEAKRLELTRPIDAHKANVKAFFDKLRARPAAIVRICSDALNEWDRKQRQIADAARTKAAAEAAAEDRLRQQRAARAAEAGNFEKAAELQAMPAGAMAVPEIAPKIPDVKGVTVKTNWKYRIKDASLLPREYLKEDDNKIGQVVRAMKGDTAIPGVEVYSETTRY